MKCARKDCDNQTKKVGGVPRVYCCPDCAKKGSTFSRMTKKKDK